MKNLYVAIDHRTGGMDEYFNDAITFSREEAFAALSKTMRYLTNDEKKHRELYVETYHVDDSYDDAEQAYEDLLDSGASLPEPVDVEMMEVSR